MRFEGLTPRSPVFFLAGQGAQVTALLGAPGKWDVLASQLYSIDMTEPLGSNMS